jgi:hypothetical protein
MGGAEVGKLRLFRLIVSKGKSGDGSPHSKEVFDFGTEHLPSG